MEDSNRVRQRLSEGERKQQIVDAAIVVARRDGLDRMTARTVASAAGTSHGLVLHHFGSMHGLQSAMLDVVLERTLVLKDENLDGLCQDDLILTFIQQQLEHFSQQSDLIGLLLDYRVLSSRNESTKSRIQTALIAFREHMEPFFASVIEREPERYAGVSETDLSRATAHFFLGFTVQQNITPGVGDINASIRALSAVLSPLDQDDRAQA